jgi:DNA-binding response OmpR family regulator
VVTGSSKNLPPSAAAILHKPVDPAELLATVRALLRKTAADTPRA